MQLLLTMNFQLLTYEIEPINAHETLWNFDRDAGVWDKNKKKLIMAHEHDERIVFKGFQIPKFALMELMLDSATQKRNAK